MRRLRISAISYLNTAPLMWDFEHGEAGRHFEISYTLPSGCARALAEGSADIGIIPAAAYTQIPELKILPDVAIASRRAVRSILLVSRKPIEEVRSVALDTSSMTSVALTKVLFEKWLGGGRAFTSMEPHIETDVGAMRCRIADRGSSVAGGSIGVSNAGPGGRVDSFYRQAICVRILGSAGRCVEPCRPFAGSSAHISRVTRSWLVSDRYRIRLFANGLAS